MSKRVPIAAARRFAEEHGLDRIVILGTQEDDTTWITTWGKTKAKCAEAARAQEFWNGTFRGQILPQAPRENITMAEEDGA